MASLNSKVQAFIVCGFAQFMKPKEIIEAVKENFAIEISQQQVGFYNPETVNGGKQLAKQWQELFAKERQKAIEDVSNIPIAHLPYRLGKLQSSLDKALKSGNMVLANDILKQAAEDIGGKYTNQSKVDSKVEQTGEVAYNHKVELTPELLKSIDKKLEDDY